MKSIVQWSSVALCAALLCAGCSSNNKLVKKTPETTPAASAGANSVGIAGVPALKTVYFAFDRADLNSGSLEALRENAAWLRAHPDVKIKAEGRCDDRGTEEYNIALGERRANVVKRYYTHDGVSASRVSTVSYGKDKPVCGEDTESCWAQNRQTDGVVEPIRTASR